MEFRVRVLYLEGSGEILSGMGGILPSVQNDKS